MALLGMESFDIYGTADITDYWVSVGLGAIVAGAGRCGSAAWHGTAAVGSGPAIGALATTLSGYAGFAYKPDSFNVGGIFNVFNSGSQSVCFLGAAADGRVQGWAGINTILGGIVCQTPPNVLHIGLYTHIGMEWLISTSGYIRLYINGTLSADSGTVDTTQFFNFGNNQWTGVSWTPLGYVDDLYWGDTSTADPLNPWASFLQIGDARCEGQLCLTDAVGGGGTFREFTPSAGGDHGALLDDNPLDQGATVVSSGTVGQRETVKFPTITPTTGQVFGVLTMPNGVKTTFATREIANAVYSHATLAVGTTQGLAQTDYRYYPQLYAYNPVTAGAWSIADVNAAESGVQVIT
jgi:hypothetical protein